MGPPYKEIKTSLSSQAAHNFIDNQKVSFTTGKQEWWSFLLGAVDRVSTKKILADTKIAMVDSIYRTRSLGIGVSGIPDQYADGKAARVWQHYIGGHRKRTESYREFFCNLLRENDVKHILDVACGTG